MERRKKHGAFVTVITLLILLASVPYVSADDLTAKTGLLTCHAAQGFGWIIGSSRTVQCRYHPVAGVSEQYSGSISKIGLDLGYLAPVVLVWAVIAPSVPGSGALAGNYFGGTAQAAVGIGGGVHVLVGGFGKSVTLQPVSLEGDMGVYVGVGVAAMSLKLEDRDVDFVNGPMPPTE